MPGTPVYPVTEPRILLSVTGDELRLLERLVGHHTAGEGLDRLYEEELRPHQEPDNKGPFMRHYRGIAGQTVLVID